MAAEKETVPANQSVAAVKIPGSEPDHAVRRRANWQDIEPILKWAAVAYAFGFLTVMLHTHKLGIPVLQLIEPVNIWIGAPLAIVVFFLDKLFGLAKRATADFVQNVTEARQIRDEVTASRVDPLELFGRFSEIMLIIITPTLPLSFLQSAAKSLVSKYIQWKASSIEQLTSSHYRGSEAPRQWLLAWMGRVLGWAYLVAAVGRLVNFFGMVLLIPLACLFYVGIIFPRVPQSLGGGAPITVELLISEEALPKTDVFRDWQPSNGKEPDSAAIPSNELKGSIVVPVTLYYRTEGQLYVRKGSGPIICLSDHAIQGIVFH
jgi:hypothetical protein